MDPNKEDRRVNQTRISLQLALKELMSERGYDSAEEIATMSHHLLQAMLKSALVELFK